MAHPGPAPWRWTPETEAGYRQERDRLEAEAERFREAAASCERRLETLDEDWHYVLHRYARAR